MSYFASGNTLITNTKNLNYEWQQTEYVQSNIENQYKYIIPNSDDMNIYENINYVSNPSSNEIININHINQISIDKFPHTNKICDYPLYYSTDMNYYMTDELLEDGINQINEMMDKISLNNREKAQHQKKIEMEIPIVYNKKEPLIFDLSSNANIKLKALPLESFLKKQDFHGKKINLILDIDSTLIHAINKEEDNVKNAVDPTDNSEIYVITISLNEKNYNLKLKIRKYVIEFLQICNKFCNLYIYTHGVEPYAKEVVKILNSKANVNIPETNIIANKPDSMIIPNINIQPKTLVS